MKDTVPKEITQYVTKAREQDLSDTEMKKALLDVGWPQEIVDAALEPETKEKESIPVPQPQEQSEQKKAPYFPTQPAQHYNMWDAFEHILMFISLYISAVSLNLLLHVLIDRWFPAVSTNSYSTRPFTQSFVQEIQNSMALGYLSAIIISYPIFAFLFSHITRKTKNNPELRNIKARKVLIYLTLVLTFMGILLQSISTVYTLLSGNISINFFFHFLVNLIIGGSIFAYYLYQIREDRNVST